MKIFKYDAFDLNGDLIVKDAPSMTFLAKCLGVNLCTVKSRLDRKITKHQYRTFNNEKTKFNVVRREVKNGND